MDVNAMLVARAMHRSIGAEDKERYVELDKRIRGLQAEQSEARWRLGAALLEMEKDDLQRGGGYVTVDQYIEERLPIGRTQARLAMMVARAFALEVARAYGIERLGAFLEYINATPAKEVPDDIFAMEIPVPTDNDSIVRKKVIDCSVRDLEAATDVVRERTAGRARKLWPAEVRKFVGRVLAAMRKLGGRAPGVSVDVPKRGQKAGEARISFLRVSFARLGEFVTILQRSLGAK